MNLCHVPLTCLLLRVITLALQSYHQGVDFFIFYVYLVLRVSPHTSFCLGCYAIRNSLYCKSAQQYVFFVEICLLKVLFLKRIHIANKVPSGSNIFLHIFMALLHARDNLCQTLRDTYNRRRNTDIVIIFQWS